MKRLLALPSVQIAFCVAVYLYAGYKGGAFVLVMASPLLAAAIARPLMTLVANFRRNLRASVLLPVHGKHYVFKGFTVRVHEDDDYCRWINLADVRKAVGVTAGDRALAATYPGRFQQLGQPGHPHLRDDALVEHLGKETGPAALRMRTWVDRTIATPGRNIRKQRAIRVEPPYS